MAAPAAAQFNGHNLRGDFGLNSGTQPDPAFYAGLMYVNYGVDDSYDVYFGPEAPDGQENNWVQTVPGKGWNMLFPLYGPLEPWFEKA